MSECSLYKGYAGRIIDEAIVRKEEFDLDEQKLAYIMATSEWETAHSHEPVVEAFWLSESWRRNNLRYYPWHGRGFVQLTWEDNYKRAQDELGLGTLLTDDPDKAMEPTIAAQIIVRGMAQGWYTGKKLSDYIGGGQADYVEARRIVNGTDKAKEIADIAEEYETLIRAVGSYEAYKERLK